MKSSLRFGVLLVLILLVGVVVNTWSYLGEARVERKDLKDFPQSSRYLAKNRNRSNTRRRNAEGFASQRLPAAGFSQTRWAGRESLRGLLRNTTFRRHLSQSLELSPGIGMDFE